MSIKITSNQNNVTVADADKSLTIINNREPNRIDIIQPESDVIYVAIPGTVGPQGAAGANGAEGPQGIPGPAANTGSLLITASVSTNVITFTKGNGSTFPITVDTGSGGDISALNSFSASILTFTSSIQGQVDNLTAATSSYLQLAATQSMLQPYVLTSTTSSMIVSGALTASYYQETDPVFVAISGTFATTSSLNSFTSSINTWTGSYNTGSFTGSFTGSLLGTSSWATSAQTASSVIVTLSSNTDERLPLIVAYTGSTSGTKLMYIDSGLEYNTSTNALYLPSAGAYIVGNTTLQSAAATFGSATAQNHIVRITGSLNVSKSVNVDGAITAGFGTGTTGFIGTASWAQSSSQALTASHFSETDPIYTAKSASLATTGSNTFIGNQVVTGSLDVSVGITGSLFGTSSWAYSASQALTASYINSLYSSNFVASFGSLTTWTINHNLNTRYVIVQTFDSNHNQLLPQDITLTDANTATATFSAAESGYAVVTVGGALLNYIAASGNNGQVQYNNNGVLGGSSNFTFDGTYAELYGALGYKALSTLTSDYYTTTELLNNRVLSTAYVTDFAGNTKFAGDVLEGSVSATTYDLVYLETSDTWLTIDQTDSAKATRMLGIYDGTDVFIEGYVVVGENGVASSVPLVAGTLTPGAPVYIKESATSAPFLDTTVPTSGVVRILGHLIRNEGSGLWFMKFRPDHTWVKI